MRPSPAAPKMSESTKQVRVDNWSVFFLQRLQIFFSKTDFCDMTLQFEGNVQLKVHRLVLSACTEYFHALEQSCTVAENTILMPNDLQADVIVPIVNFMYTGMLDFQYAIFDRLYRAAELMNITILTKLLDAQKLPRTKACIRRFDSAIRKATVKSVQLPDQTASLPGKKLPFWKRKDHQRAIPDPLLVSEAAKPRPTRFEWPEVDLPTLNLMDTSFEDISYNSKPLLTRADVQKPGTSFDDLKHIPNAARDAAPPTKKHPHPAIELEDLKSYVKEQKIRSVLSHHEEAADGELRPPKRARLEPKPKNYPAGRPVKFKVRAKQPQPHAKLDAPKAWSCDRCPHVSPFALYYLYRKHMTDVHNATFHPLLCRHCGRRCAAPAHLHYHQLIAHDLKPPADFTFHQCDGCPHTAPVPAALRRHRRRHTAHSRQCATCALAFDSAANLMAHAQITNHTGGGPPTFDCQYCSKRFVAALPLLTHVRDTHLRESVRDGMIIEENVENWEEEGEEEEEEEDDKGENQIERSSTNSKVQILSNVKVPTLEPSSEAEALSNVATGIATSLGLVEYVVLNEQNQGVFSGEEFILPEIQGEEGGEGELLTNSTDELVMVLTDHDYDENQVGEGVGVGGVSGGNDSNIVVLYSHPVSGGGEFGGGGGGGSSRLMVNEATGLLELRNGGREEEDEGVEVGVADESIELIQKEIERQETNGRGEGEGDGEEEEVKSGIRVDELGTRALEEELEGRGEENTKISEEEEEEKNRKISEEEEEEGKIRDEQDELRQEEEAKINEDGEIIDKHNQMDESSLEARQLNETNQLTDTNLETNRLDDSNLETSQLDESNLETSQLDDSHLETSQLDESHLETSQLDDSHLETSQLDDSHLETSKLNDSHLETSQLDESHLGTSQSDETSVETSQLDDLHLETSQSDEASVETRQLNENQISEHHLSLEPNLAESDEIEPELTEAKHELEAEPAEPDEEEEEEEEEPEPELEVAEPDPELVEDPEPVEASIVVKGVGVEETPAMKMAILDDWEDTDSQTSEGQAKGTAVAVTKLVDEWEDEDDDENKE